MKQIIVFLLALTALLVACTPAANNISTSIPPTSTSLPIVPTETLTPIPTATFTPSATATSQPLCFRIMPLGDSITFGEPDIGYGGYRNLLGTLLTKDGYIIDFVGSQQNGIGVIPDPENEGHPGWKISNIQNAIDSQGWLEIYQPDIILLHIGTNDIRVGYAVYAPEHLAALLDDILLRLPETHVIVAMIIPFWSGPIDGHLAYNAAITDIAASRGPRVSVVDMQSILLTGDFADAYHPNAQGYDKMARAWETAILGLEWESFPDRACPAGS